MSRKKRRWEDSTPIEPVASLSGDLLESNLAHLALRFPEAEDRVKNADISDLFCQRNPGGPVRIGRKAADGIDWLVDDEEESGAIHAVREGFCQRLKENKSRLFVLAGLGSGGIASGLLEDLAGQNQGILVLEANAPLFHAVLRLKDLGAVLESRKFFFAVGKDFLAQAEAILENYNLCVVKELCLLFRESNPNPQWRQSYVLWAQDLAGRKKTLELALNQKVVQFLGRPRVVTAERIRKVWICERSPDSVEFSRVQHHLAGKFAQAIAATGTEVCGPEYQPETYYPPFYAVHNLMEADPDVALIVNTFSTDEGIFGKNFSNRLNIPKVIWFMDTPMLGLEHLKKTGLAKGEILASTDTRWFDDVRQACPQLAERQVHALPLAATYDEVGPEDEAWSCPVSYVGQVRDLSPIFGGKDLSKRVRKILDRIIEVMVDGKGQRPDELVQNSDRLAELRRQYDLQQFLQTYYNEMVWEANSRHRVRTLTALADLGLRVYGNPDWAKLTSGTPLQSCFTGKTVAHHDLPRLFRNSRINVNMHHLQSTTSLNQRVFDVPAAGGLLITDAMPGLENVFEPDKEVVIYHSPEQLREKVLYYLEHPEQRREIAERARARVLKDHTFANRWQRLLDILRREGWR